MAAPKKSVQVHSHWTPTPSEGGASEEPGGGASGRPILLIGSNGQLGWELMRCLQPLGRVVAATRAGTANSGGAPRVELAEPDTIRAAVRNLRPALVVNAAAYTAVDRAEEEKELAGKINGEAPGILAEEAARVGAPLVHYSTDYVFDGEKADPYREDDPACPVNSYGASKLAGEKAISAVGGPHLILRTSWVYGRRGANFLFTMQRLMREREELRIVADQWGAPTWSRMAAEATAQILASVAGGGEFPFARLAERSGLYHLTSAGRTTWHGFAAAIQEKSDDPGARRCRLVPIPTAEYPTPAARPRNSVLDNARVLRDFRVKLPDWETALQLCMAQEV